MYSGVREMDRDVMTSWVERGGRGTVHETRGAEEGGGLAEEGRYASMECVCACVRACVCVVE